MEVQPKRKPGRPRKVVKQAVKPRRSTRSKVEKVPQKKGKLVKKAPKKVSKPVVEPVMEESEEDEVGQERVAVKKPKLLKASSESSVGELDDSDESTIEIICIAYEDSNELVKYETKKHAMKFFNQLPVAFQSKAAIKTFASHKEYLKYKNALYRALMDSKGTPTSPKKAKLMRPPVPAVTPPVASLPKVRNPYAKTKTSPSLLQKPSGMVTYEHTPETSGIFEALDKTLHKMGTQFNIHWFSGTPGYAEKQVIFMEYVDAKKGLCNWLHKPDMWFNLGAADRTRDASDQLFPEDFYDWTVVCRRDPNSNKDIPWTEKVMSRDNRPFNVSAVGFSAMVDVEWDEEEIRKRIFDMWGAIVSNSTIQKAYQYTIHKTRPSRSIEEKTHPIGSQDNNDASLYWHQFLGALDHINMIDHASLDEVYLKQDREHALTTMFSLDRFHVGREMYSTDNAQQQEIRRFLSKH